MPPAVKFAGINSSVQGNVLLEGSGGTGQGGLLGVDDDEFGVAIKPVDRGEHELFQPGREGAFAVIGWHSGSGQKIENSNKYWATDAVRHGGSRIVLKSGNGAVNGG